MEEKNNKDREENKYSITDQSWDTPNTTEQLGDRRNEKREKIIQQSWQEEEEKEKKDRKAGGEEGTERSETKIQTLPILALALMFSLLRVSNFWDMLPLYKNIKSCTHFFPSSFANLLSSHSTTLALAHLPFTISKTSQSSTIQL